MPNNNMTYYESMMEAFISGDSFIHYYEQDSAFTGDYYGDYYHEPWVSYTEETDKVHYNKRGRTRSLTFEIQTNGNILWKKTSTATAKTIEYTKDGGLNWSSITSTDAGVSIPVQAGDVLQFRGENNSYGGGSNVFNSFSGSTAQFKVSGNIMSLISPTNYATANTLSTANAFYGLFFDCTAVTDAGKLVLPADTLSDFCYSDMFKNCSNLAKAPELPATTLATGCYAGMFVGCGALTKVPNLPATTLAAYCYAGMYNSCTGLTSIAYDYLPASAMASSCYYGMFALCSNLTSIPNLPATTLASECYSYMFDSCTSLIRADNIGLPATTLATACYAGMFVRCTSLTKTPELPATSLAENCYFTMFASCTTLTVAPELPATTLAVECYASMFAFCNSLTGAPALPATALTKGCYQGMFNGCTSLTTAPDLPAPTLAENCYWFMFEEATNLNYIKCLATDISATQCLGNWVKNVQTTSGTFVKVSGITWPSGWNGIPNNWTVQNAS